MIRFLRLTIALLVLLAVLNAAPGAGAAARRAGAVTTSSTSLNIRSGPSASAPSVGRVKKGSYITLLEKSGAWWRVEYDRGKTGYCHGDYITVVQGTAVSVNIQSGTLNVRTGPGTSHQRAAALGKGEAVLLLSTQNGWSRILFHGTKTGYVSAQYLSGYYPAVSLSVPELMQNDSRWGSKPLGSSGKTIAQAGCATTAIAMLESHRTGSVIYPDAMAQSLRYTPSGDVYWPSHFRVTTSGADYLQRIYDLLRQGKPVLFGARNQYGSQHWVVITGFTGGTALSPAAFTIQDPGTKARTNLQQLLSQYPTFYKFFIYA